MRNTLFALALLLSGYGVYSQQLSSSSELALSLQPNLAMQKVLATASSVRVEEISGFQSGYANTQQLTSVGENKQLNFIQEGNLNLIDMQMMGGNAKFQIIQQGNSNSLRLHNIQTRNNSLEVIQRGNGNQLIDSGSGLMSRSIRIEQTGGMKLYINGQ